MTLSYYYQDEAVSAMLGTLGNDLVVLPTASGKSYVIRKFVERYKGRVLIVSHVKEIVEQDYDCLSGLPEVGLYSAGLGIKAVDRITVASIQSIYKDPWPVDVVLIDEAHLVGNIGMYKTLLDKIKAPYFGLTATPSRLGEGYIYGEKGMFDSVCYEAQASELTKKGYLSPLKYYSDKQIFNTQGLKTIGGDYSVKEMALKFNREEVTKVVMSKIPVNRKKMLVFCIDIAHSEQVAKELRILGLRAKAVHSDNPRDQTILDFKNGELDAITNVNILTTGFNVPDLDTIVILRPTKSLTLHIQMLGRGTRIYPGKEFTLIKDFTTNTQVLGTLEDPITPTSRNKGSGGQNKFLKTCPVCDLILHPSVRVCECGHKFKFEHNIKTEAFKEKVAPRWIEVTGVFYHIHNKKGSPDSLKIVYSCGVDTFTEWVLYDHTGYAKYKSRHIIDRLWNSSDPKPSNVHELYQVTDKLKKPSRIKVDVNSKFPVILDRYFKK